MSVGLPLPAPCHGQGAPLSPASIWLLDMTDKKRGEPSGSPLMLFTSTPTGQPCLSDAGSASFGACQPPPTAL